MPNIRALLRAARLDEQGQTMAEYAVTLTVIVIVVAAAALTGLAGAITGALDGALEIFFGS